MFDDADKKPDPRIAPCCRTLRSKPTPPFSPNGRCACELERQADHAARISDEYEEQCLQRLARELRSEAVENDEALLCPPDLEDAEHYDPAGYLGEDGKFACAYCGADKSEHQRTGTQ